MIRATMIVGLAVVFAGPARAGKYNAVLNIGDKAPAWTN